MSTAVNATSDQPKQPPKMLMNIVNPVMRALLSSPLHGMLSGRLMVLHIKGRRSGNQYDVPVGYAQSGTTPYTGTERRWASNLRGGADIEVAFKGKRRPARADVLSDIDEQEPAYRAIFTASPGYAKALTRATGVTFGPQGEVARDDIERSIRAGHVIVRTILQNAD